MFQIRHEDIWFYEELQSLPSLHGKFTAIATDSVSALNERIFQTFYSKNDLYIPQNVLNVVDAKDCSDNEVSDILDSFLLNSDEFVFVLWFRTRLAIKIRRVDLIVSFSDLWSPSRDDIAIFGQDMSFMINVDHEEIFRYCVPMCQTEDRPDL